MLRVVGRQTFQCPEIRLQAFCEALRNDDVPVHGDSIQLLQTHILYFLY